MKESSRKRIWLIARIAVSVGLVAFLAKAFDLSSLPALFRGLRPQYVALALALITLAVAASARKWLVLVRGQNIDVGYGELFAAYLTGFFFNNFLPSSIGGDAARVVYVGKKRGLVPEMTASVVAERVLAMVSLSVVGLAGAIFSVHRNIPAVVILIAVFVFSAFLFLVIINGLIPDPIRRGMGRISRAICDASDSVRLLRGRPSLVARSFVGSAVFQTLVAAVMFSILYAFGITSVPFIDMLFIASASSVLAMAPVGINGYGLREGSYVLLLAPYGIGADSAVSVSLLFAFLVAGFSLSGLFTWLFSGRIHTLTLRKEDYAEEN